jgi:uridine kinase
MLFLKAVADVFGDAVAQIARVEFAVKNGTYISAGVSLPATEENAEKILNRMQELQKQAVPFMKDSYYMDDAMALFKEKGMKDKGRLFRYRRSSMVNLYEIDGYYDYYYGYMLPNAGYVKWFDVIVYDEGFMLLLPDKKEPNVVREFMEQKKLFQTLKESEKWAKEIGLETVGELNDRICNGSLSDLILVQEAQQERLM